MPTFVRVLHRRAAPAVAKIQKGRRPADIPAEPPTRYEPIVNLTTATAIGAEIPPAVLERADKVLQ